MTMNNPVRIIATATFALLASCGQEQGRLTMLQQQMRAQAQESSHALDQMSTKLAELQAQNTEMRQTLARLADSGLASAKAAGSTGAIPAGDERVAAALAQVEARLASLELLISKLQPTPRAGPSQVAEEQAAPVAGSTTTGPAPRVEMIEKKRDGEKREKIPMVFPEHSPRSPAASPGAPATAPERKP